jgi:hypothetical protein
MVSEPAFYRTIDLLNRVWVFGGSQKPAIEHERLETRLVAGFWRRFRC